MKNLKPQETKVLLLKHAGLFTDCYEWCLLERIYYACNTQSDRKWVCRLSYLRKTTPIKRDATLLPALNRLCEKRLIERIPFGKPIRLRGKDELIQRFQYVADQSTIDKKIAKMTPTKAEDKSYELVGPAPTKAEDKSYELVPYSQEESTILIEQEDSHGVPDQDDPFAMIDDIQTEKQKGMADQMDYRNAQANRFQDKKSALDEFYNMEKLN